MEIPVGEAPSGVASDERVEVLHVADEQPANVKIIQDDVIAVRVNAFSCAFEFC